jgi:hypothetical protein
MPGPVAAEVTEQAVEREKEVGESEFVGWRGHRPSVNVNETWFMRHCVENWVILPICCAVGFGLDLNAAQYGAV